MAGDELGPDARTKVQEILGYLDFASGSPDARFLHNLNELFGLIEGRARRKGATWRALGRVLREGIGQLRGSSDAFRRLDQARAVVRLVFSRVLPAYQGHHADLLFHQTPEGLFRPLFIGRVCEAVLQEGPPWNEDDRIVPGAILRLNDYLGHRPVAVLQTQQRIQPYAHEWVRPIPLYVRGAGIGVGPYAEIIERGLAILAATDPSIRFPAFFDPGLLDELAMDPRAYDFDHPVNSRPNYLFGQWDLHRLDNSGNSRRFVVQQAALEAMRDRVERHGELPRDEVLVEAGAILAGTMLMGSGVGGNRPDAHDSNMTLATLVQRIAAYRDAFYDQFLDRLSGPHARRLRAEAAKLKQPLGGARQHFNHYLARQRAAQLQHVHLGQLFARMGSFEAANRQVRVVPVASARMQCEMQCRLAAARIHIQRGQLDRAASLLPEIEDLLHRAIECGAMVDPWNILGFGGQYSLFPALENSIPDHRVDDLIDLVGEIFSLYVRLKKAAAAAGHSDLQDALSEGLDRLAGWWDRYATAEIGAVESLSGRETCHSADEVAAALRAWHAAGTAAGDIAFWRACAEEFSSPKTYALVVEALLEQRDLVAAQALLVHWLSQAEQIPLAAEDYSFHELAIRWMESLWRDDRQPKQRSAPGERWALSRKFLDYLEANAEQYWEVPRFDLAAESARADDEAPEPDGPDDLFSAAYESVTYRDSTDDGVAGEVLHGGGNDATDFELALEAERIAGRLAFLSTLADLWKSAAVASMHADAGDPQRDEVLAGWLRRAAANRRQLLQLLLTVHRHRIPPPRGTLETLVEYDRRRAIKDAVSEQIITTCVETADAGRMIRASLGSPQPGQRPQDLEEWDHRAGQVLHALLRGDVAAVRRGWPKLIAALRGQPLLYTALARGGAPGPIVASRSLQYVLRRLLAYLPRFGLLAETGRLIEVVREMERAHPIGRDAITEFDQMFRIGCRGIVRCLTESSSRWFNQPRLNDLELINCLEGATEVLLQSWLEHSQGVWLSVLEAVGSPKLWNELKQFIERYGRDLFTQRFMNLGNLRGILHQGVDAWLQSIEDEPEAQDFRLLAELDGPLKRDDAARLLTMTLEAVAENYAEYVDYNSITTQSDRGDMLYTLLDFLRLRASYDRVAWNLLPVMLTHEVLVRCGRDQAAAIWRDAVAEKTADIADSHLARLASLDQKYGMRLPSIAGRLGERFIRPLTIDRLAAMVEPAIEEIRHGEKSPTLRRLEKETGRLTKEAPGAGFEAPPWLEALEDEAARVLSDGHEPDADSLEPFLCSPQVRLTFDKVWKQLNRMGG